MIPNAISCLKRIAIVPKTAPNDKEPTSPINISAGYELYHKNPNPEPTIALAKIAISEKQKVYT